MVQALPYQEGAQLFTDESEDFGSLYLLAQGLKAYKGFAE